MVFPSWNDSSVEVQQQLSPRAALGHQHGSPQKIPQKQRENLHSMLRDDKLK